MISEKDKSLFLEYATQQIPREACGVLVEREGKEIQLVVCRNDSEAPDHFILNADDYLAAERFGKIVGVVHSHVMKPANPSDADQVGCDASKLPWFIVSVPAGTWREVRPQEHKKPLIGRPFAYGIQDCYVLLQDYYREVLGIELKDFDHGSWGWWDRGQDKFSPENCNEAGFYEIELSEIKEHDMLAMQIHGKAINHVAIYLGNDLILHHLARRLSSRDVFSGYYRRHTVRAYRHKDLPK